MSKWSPCKRKNFIQKLRNLGFKGLYSGTRHQFMIYKKYRLSIPSNNEYSVPQLKMMVKEIESIIKNEISIDIWNSL